MGMCLGGRSRQKLIFLLAGLVFCAFGGLSSAYATDKADVTLIPGDRISVTVFGQQELSGTFSINDEGNVDFPLLGSIVLGNQRIREAEKLIEARLADGFVLQPSVNIRVVDHRPVYVLGDVRNPGAVAFRHGSTVLAVIAQAGGYGFSGQGQVASARADLLLADERVITLQTTQKLQQLRKHRLLAQSKGRSALAPSDFNADALKDPLFAAALEEEKEALKLQTDALIQEVALLREQRPRLEAAQAAIERQITAERAQFELVQEQLVDQERLQSKGLSRRSSQIALERERAALESNISRYRGEVARMAVMIGDIDIRIQDTYLAYRRRLQVELDAVRAKLYEISVVLPIAREIRDVRAQSTGQSAASERGQSYRISIRRSNGVAESVRVVGETAQVRPGDIIEVERLRASEAGAVTSGRQVEKTWGRAARNGDQRKELR